MTLTYAYALPRSICWVPHGCKGYRSVLDAFGTRQLLEHHALEPLGTVYTVAISMRLPTSRPTLVSPPILGHHIALKT